MLLGRITSYSNAGSAPVASTTIRKRQKMMLLMLLGVWHIQVAAGTGPSRHECEKTSP